MFILIKGKTIAWFGTRVESKFHVTVVLWLKSANASSGSGEVQNLAAFCPAKPGESDREGRHVLLRCIDFAKGN